MIVRTIVPEGMPRPTGQEGQVLLDAVWAYFRKHHRWPTFDDIDRKLYAQGVVFEEAVQQLCPALLRGVDVDLWRLPQGSDVLVLTLAGAANCADTHFPARSFLHMVRTAAFMEPRYQSKEPGTLPELRPVNIGLPVTGSPEVAELNTKTAFAAFSLALHEPCFRGGSHNPEDLDDWTLRFDRGIRPFADVHQVDEYWRIREQVLGPARVEADNTPFGKRPTLHAVPAASSALAAPAAGSPEPMSVTCNLHPLIQDVVAELFNSGFYREAVRSAFQAIEHRVQTLAGSNEVGEKLMGIAFGAKPDPPRLTVTRSTDGNLESERNGMQFLFKGATGALRNPRMHGPAEQDGRDETEEMLVFASFLMRRLDIEDDKRKAAGSGS